MRLNLQGVGNMIILRLIQGTVLYFFWLQLTYLVTAFCTLFVVKSACKLECMQIFLLLSHQFFHIDSRPL